MVPGTIRSKGYQTEYFKISFSKFKKIYKKRQKHRLFHWILLFLNDIIFKYEKIDILDFLIKESVKIMFKEITTEIV